MITLSYILLKVDPRQRIEIDWDNTMQTSGLLPSRRWYAWTEQYCHSMYMIRQWNTLASWTFKLRISLVFMPDVIYKAYKTGTFGIHTNNLINKDVKWGLGTYIEYTLRRTLCYGECTLLLAFVKEEVKPPKASFLKANFLFHSALKRLFSALQE